MSIGFIKKSSMALMLALGMLFASISWGAASNDPWDALLNLLPAVRDAGKRALSGPIRSDFTEIVPSLSDPNLTGLASLYQGSEPGYVELIRAVYNIIEHGGLSQEAKNYYRDWIGSLDSVFKDMGMGAAIPAEKRQEVFDFLASLNFLYMNNRLKDPNHLLEYFNPKNIYNYLKWQFHYMPKWKSLADKGYIYVEAPNRPNYEEFAKKSSLGLGSLALAGAGAYYYNTWKPRYLRSILLAYQQTGAPIEAAKLYAIESDPSFWREIVKEVIGVGPQSLSLESVLMQNNPTDIMRLLELAINRLSPARRLYRYMRSFA